jgi:hypothetical protein
MKSIIFEACQIALGPSHVEVKLNDHLLELYHREEIMWRQMSRVQWLSEGDKNSKFFHQRASMRRPKNLMKARTSDDGQFIEDKNEMQSMAAEFYKTLYTSEGVHDMNQVLEHVPRKVTQAMNAILTAEFEPKRRLKRHYSRCSRLKLPDLMATQLFSFKNIGMYVALKLHVLS